MTTRNVLKSSGTLAEFSEEKLRKSLEHSGATPYLIDQIVDQVSSEAYDGMSTRAIYNRAYALLKKEKKVFASRYKLKKAIYELGPTGFPFEKFIAALLDESGYMCKTNQNFQGTCVSHEVDVVAVSNNHLTLIECKFHADNGKYCDVKVPLYIHSRFRDIQSAYHPKAGSPSLNPIWVATNTRFTEDATAYGTCAGLYLLSWNYPEGDSLKNRIDRLGLYPITVSVLLTKYEKHQLLDRGIVLCKQLLGAMFYLDHLGISETRQQRIKKELHSLCKRIGKS